MEQVLRESLLVYPCFEDFWSGNTLYLIIEPRRDFSFAVSVPSAIN